MSNCMPKFAEHDSTVVEQVLSHPSQEFEAFNQHLSKFPTTSILSG
jgi:hypothetical protein